MSFDSRPMRWHCLQHVEFEGPAALVDWIRTRGHVLTITGLWEASKFPRPDDYDGLFILGGPMSVYEFGEYPWLAAEQEFIARAVSARKPILGICLGAQLLAAVLGGSVTRMVDQEIGWFPVELTPAGRRLPLFPDFPDRFPAFHWHSECFSIPPGAVHTARSEACREQAFVYKNHVVGLQFHLECNRQLMAALIQHCGENLCSGPYIQALRVMANESDNSPAAHRLLFSLLDRLASRTPSPRRSAWSASARGSQPRD